MIRAVQTIALALGATVLALVAAEIVARSMGVTDHLGRLISTDDAPQHLVEGVVLWGVRSPRFEEKDLQRVAATPGTFEVIGLGDSVLYGIDLPKEQTYMEVARRIVTQRSTRPVAMLNLAIPGYSTEQENAAYKELEGRIHPNLVLVHYWEDDAAQFRAVGTHVVDFGDISDDGRTIIRPFPLPVEVSDFLLVHSRVYEVATAAALRMTHHSQPRDWTHVTKPLAEIQARAERAGARMLILASAQLNGATVRPTNDLPLLRDFGATHGIEVIDVSAWLSGIDSRRVAMDGCHFNAEGHRLLGEHFAEYLLTHDLKPTASERSDGPSTS